MYGNSNNSLALSIRSELKNDDNNTYHNIHRGFAKIYVWKSRGMCHGFFSCCTQTSHRLGHVSMQLYNLNGTKIHDGYISAWPIQYEEGSVHENNIPINNETLLNVSLERFESKEKKLPAPTTEVIFMPSYQDDVNAENGTQADQVFEITGLDIAPMLTKFNQIKNMPHLAWKVYGSNVLRNDDSINCVGIVLCLLFEGYHQHELDSALANSGPTYAWVCSFLRALLMPMQRPPACGLMRDELQWMIIQHAGVTKNSDNAKRNIMFGITFLLSTFGWLTLHTNMTVNLIQGNHNDISFFGIPLNYIDVISTIFALYDLLYWLPRALTNTRAMLCGISPDDFTKVLEQAPNFSNPYAEEIGTNGLLAKNITSEEIEREELNNTWCSCAIM